jgi:hypothetical protein
MYLMSTPRIRFLCSKSRRLTASAVVNAQNEIRSAAGSTVCRFGFRPKINAGKLLVTYFP